MRTVKDPIERREEILDAAQQLFMRKGFAKSTINDILEMVGIAKGTFYHYFKSKEEVMDAIVTRVVQIDYAKAKQIADDASLSARQKLRRIVEALQLQGVKEKLLVQLHQSGNAEMHEKSLTQSILTLSPLLGDVVRQGMGEGVFQTDYPQEAVEIILAASNFLFDEHLFNWNEQELRRRMEALADVMERALAAESGSLRFIAGDD